MASRRLVPASVRESLLGIASDIGSLERNHVLPDEDLELIATRRRPDNRLVLASHIATQGNSRKRGRARGEALSYQQRSTMARTPAGVPSRKSERDGDT